MSEPKGTDVVSDGELSPTSQIEDNEVDNARTTRRSVSLPSKSSSSSKKKKSKYEMLDEKWNEKFVDFDRSINNKFDNFFTKMVSTLSELPQRNSGANSHELLDNRSQRPLSPDRRSQRPPQDEQLSQRRRVVDFSDHSESGDENEDQISLQIGEDERSVLDDREDTKSDDDQCEKTKKCLFDIFGNDAITKKSEKKTGIAIDESQRQVLNSSWRSGEA